MNHFRFRNMFLGLGFFWVFVSNFTAYVSEAIFGFILNLLRFYRNENSAQMESFPSNFEEKQSLFSGFEEKQNLVDGFEEKQSLVDGFKKKQRILDGVEGKQSILNGFEEKQSLFYGFEEKQDLVGGFEENHDLVDGIEGKQSIADGSEEKQSILDGVKENHDLVDGFEGKQSIADGFEEKQSIADGVEGKQSDEHVEDGGNRGKDNIFVPTCSKYEFIRGKDISGFIEEPKFESFTLLEFYAEILDETEEYIEGAISELFSEKTKTGEKTEDSVRSLIAGKTWENQQTEEGFYKFVENQEEEERDDAGLETEDEETFNSIDLESISRSEEEEEDDFDYEQLKTQLQNSRRGGLPTISEESEFSRMVEMEQLQPLKVEEKFEHKDQIAKIQKVYRTYLDKMKKLDILNSQTTHAIGLLSLTNLVGQNPTVQSSTLRINPRLPKKIWPFKQEKHLNNRAMELVRDLELVYVGQMCLSWEILRWQHDKTLELIQHDPQGIYRYNQVVEEFQLFQVLVHRFLENEPFQCRPRVENYAKNRCVRSIFLQIPVIKGSKGARVKEEDYACATSSLMLKEVMEESMQVFWEFLRMDKHQINSSSKAPQQRQVAPQDPLDLRLLMNVRGDLEKKEKRVKEMIRCKSCIVKKLQKHQRTPLDHPMFIAQVELKLVSRVLNMSKLSTDHLVWCHEKLEKMKFSGRKLEVQPSILLFPS